MFLQCVLYYIWTWKIITSPLLSHNIYDFHSHSSYFSHFFIIFVHLSQTLSLLKTEVVSILDLPHKKKIYVLPYLKELIINHPFKQNVYYIFSTNNPSYKFFLVLVLLQTKWSIEVWSVEEKKSFYSWHWRLGRRDEVLSEKKALGLHCHY